MLPSPKVVKCNARAALKNKWPQSIAVSFIVLAAFIFNNFFLGVLQAQGSAKNLILMGVLLICTAFFVVLTIPLFFGAIRWFWFLAIEKELPVAEIFYYYSDFRLFVRTLGLYVRLLLRTVFFGFCCFIPLIVLLVLQNQAFYDLTGLKAPMVMPILWPLEYVFFLIGMFLTIVIMMKYSLSPIIAVMNDDIPLSSVIKNSARLVGNERAEVLSFICSFIGWFLLGLLGIPLFYTLPFIIMSYSVFSKFIFFAHRKNAAALGEKPLI